MTIFTDRNILGKVQNDSEPLPSLLFVVKEELDTLAFNPLFWQRGKMYEFSQEICDANELIRAISNAIGLPEKARSFDQFFDELIDASILPDNGLVIIFRSINFNKLVKRDGNLFFVLLNSIQSLSTMHQYDSKKVFQIILSI
jgi:hypothetical protein